MEGLETSKLLSSSTTTLVTNVPKREESRAKRHFEKHEINNVKRWKCKYCLTNYGLTTSTSSLWKHLEHKHKEKLSAEDTKQKSGHENVKSNGHTLEVLGSTECSSLILDSQTDSSGSINIYPDSSTAVPSSFGKRKHLIDANSSEEIVHKRLVGCEQSSLARYTPDAFAKKADPVENSIGFLNLVTDIATIQPSQFETFQDLLVQNVFLQPSGPYIFPNVDHVDVMRDRILSTQRNRVIDIVGQQCSWKFDMNIYPVFLKEKTYLILDLIYRNKNHLHQSCFLDCLEMPDKYPTELLSLMVFRRLCEFRIENRLWQLFIGDSSLRGLAETLKKMFTDNKLADQFVYATVDFFNHNFTVQAEKHNQCLSDLLLKVDECLIKLENIRMFLADTRGVYYDGMSYLMDYDNVSKVVTPEHFAQIEEELNNLRISGGHFQKDMTSIKWWFKRHLFLAYHLCNHCYYLCSDVERYREIVDDLTAKFDYLACALTKKDVKREQWLSPDTCQTRLTNWKDTLLWWKRKSQEYQELRHTVLNFVASNDNTSSFTQQFSKMSQVAPELLPNDRWMKYTFWQIWKNFEKNDIAK